MKFVISLGGSVFIPKGEVDTEFLKKFKKIILNHKKHDFIIVCGGGTVSRVYSEACEKLKISEEEAHALGRDITLINAKLVTLIFGKNAVYMHGAPSHLVDVFKRGEKILITGGYKPGWNTDVVAAHLAGGIKADLLINLTNINHIYTKDPRKHEDAKPVNSMTWEQLEKILGKGYKPGANQPFHPEAAQACARAGIKMAFLSGLENLKKALNKERFVGTYVF